MTARPNFRPIGPLLVDDEALAKVADRFAVPVMVTPDPKPAIAEEIPAQDAPQPDRGSTPTPTRAKRTAAKKKRPASETMKFSAKIPLYVSKAINLRAAEEGCTGRHLLLQGMRAIGIAVEDADLIPDGRRPGK